MSCSGRSIGNDPATVLTELAPWLGGLAAVGAMILYIRRHRDFIREDGVGLVFVFTVVVLALKWLVSHFGGAG